MDKRIVNSSQAREVLKKYWGYEAFRPLQEEIILHVANGLDALALLPTGGGKSVCFQVPALVLPGVCIVISPLIALMKDQVENLKERGIAAAAVYTGLSPNEIQLYLNRAANGELKFLYVSPERLQNRQFLACIREMKVCLIAVDEAHCVSQWGYDFRPPYLRISELREYFPEVPLLALTATATLDVVDDIVARLKIKGRQVFRKSFVRENLVYYVVEEEDKLGRMVRAIRKIGGCGVVYVRNRRKTTEIAAALTGAGISATAYHAGLSIADKDARQEAWMKNNIQVIVATNAFGMGIDKPDVRFVIHIDLPDTIEAYFQEAGRGGRDGKPAYALLMCHESDRSQAKKKFEKTYPSLSFIKQVYEGLCNYYRLPVGMGEGSEEDFVLSEFVNAYGFPMQETVSALGFLEREGLLRFSDTAKASSQIYILARQEHLYDFEVSHHEYEPLIKSLLRTYGGRLFCDYVPISETELARKTQKEEALIIKQLTQMHKDAYIEYKPLSKKPTLIFLQPRIDTKMFSISAQIYKERKEIAEKKLQAVLDYSLEIKQCRSIYLVSYFGEKSFKGCKKCDYCLRKEREGLSNSEYEFMCHIISPVMENEALDIRSLCDRFPDLDQDKCCLFWRYIIDKGYIKPAISEGEGLFKWVKK